jgi:hypothetical protein
MISKLTKKQEQQIPIYLKEVAKNRVQNQTNQQKEDRGCNILPL